MLRFKILVAIAPLIAIGVVAKIELSATSRPCIAVGAGTLEIGSEPWHADLHVDFTDDPKDATVRVALVDSPEAADFVVVDDSAPTAETTCGPGASAQSVTIAIDPARLTPRIYLAAEGPADYRIFVRSQRFTAQQAAALIVGAHAGRQVGTQAAAPTAIDPIL